MGMDSKYGKVSTERGEIPDSEPVFLFRAQDGLLPEVLRYYEFLCRQAGSPDHHVLGVLAARGLVDAWQAEHPHQVPQSATVRDVSQPAPGGSE